METRILGNVSIHGSVRLAQNEAGFPANPQIGTIIVKDQCIYAYIKIGGLETWYPFASRTNSYVHVQGLPALVWNINHGLGTMDIWSQVKDDSGNIVQALVSAVDEDNATISFTTPITGTAVIVAPDTIDVPEVKAVSINVANSAVIIDSSGVRIDGSYALTAANIETYAQAAVQGEANIRAAADTTLQNNINAEATTRANADTAIQSTISNNIDQSVKTTATPQFAGLKLTGHVLPNTDIAFDLGSVNKRFRDLYLSGSSIHLGDGKISYNATTNTFDILNPQSAPAKTSLGANTTDDLAEGSNRLYFTTARAQALIDVEATARQSADNALQTLIGEKQNILGFTPENIANRGVANGYASLGSDGKVPAAQLPSYVDDVVEYTNLSGFPTTGETAKIYVALDTNKTYRWSGTAYVQITSGAVDSVAGKSGVVTLDKSDVGLSAVDNTADSVKSVLSASRLTTARIIGGTSFDGQSNIDISYTNLIDKPTLGTAASKDTPTSGNATTSQVVLGNDTRLSDARTPTAHDQGWSTITSTPTTLAGYGISDATPLSHVGSGGTAHSVATTLTDGFMSTSDKTKLNGIADNANNYIHPTTDGNLHVPATGTTNSGNVLVAGSSAGSFSWQALTKTTFGLGNVDNTRDVNKPISTATQTALNTKLNSSNGLASNLTLNDGYTEEVFVVSGTTPVLSPTNGSIQTWVLSGNSTPTLGTWASGQSIMLGIDDGSAATITWPTITWTVSTGVAPTLATSGLTWISLWKVGTTIYGKY